MKVFIAVVIVIAAIASYPTTAQAFDGEQLTLKTGNWSVFRSVDTMTDKVVCKGVHKLGSRVQMSSDVLLVGFDGGVKSIILRFGDNPPQTQRRATDVEKFVGAVALREAEFAEALETNRLRVQVVTFVRGLATEDLDTTGIQSAVQHIKAGCPAPAPAPAP